MLVGVDAGGDIGTVIGDGHQGVYHDGTSLVGHIAAHLGRITRLTRRVRSQQHGNREYDAEEELKATKPIGRSVTCCNPLVRSR